MLRTHRKSVRKIINFGNVLGFQKSIWKIILWEKTLLGYGDSLCTGYDLRCVMNNFIFLLLHTYFLVCFIFFLYDSYWLCFPSHFVTGIDTSKCVKYMDWEVVSDNLGSKMIIWIFDLCDFIGRIYHQISLNSNLCSLKS